jgi:mono/diheme cytochrome c family protein
VDSKSLPASAPEAVVQAIQTGGCGACHVIPGVDGAVGVVGPSLAQVASHAEEVIASADYQGQATSAEEYIRESIVNPNAYVVPNFPSGVMPQNFEQTLSADQLDALVAYLATLQ